MNATRTLTVHIGEDGVCEPDCTGCHSPGNGDDCPSYQQGDAEQPCGTCQTDDLLCTRCGRDVTSPGLCFDCDVEGSYVGGLAPRFGAQP